MHDTAYDKLAYLRLYAVHAVLEEEDRRTLKLLFEDEEIMKQEEDKSDKE